MGPYSTSRNALPPQLMVRSGWTVWERLAVLPAGGPNAGSVPFHLGLTVKDDELTNYRTKVFFIFKSDQGNPVLRNGIGSALNRFVTARRS